MSNSMLHDLKSKPDEHCLSLSRNSSPSKSDQEPTSQVHPKFLQRILNAGNSQPIHIPVTGSDLQSVVSRTSQGLNLSSEHVHQRKPEHYRNIALTGASEVRCSGTDTTSAEAWKFHNLVCKMISA